MADYSWVEANQLSVSRSGGTVSISFHYGGWADSQYGDKTRIKVNGAVQQTVTGGASCSGTYSTTRSTGASGSETFTVTCEGAQSSSETWTQRASTTIKATWTAQTFTVSYNKGAHGTGTNTSDTKTYGVALTLKGAIFTRSGYKQTGWSTTDGGAKAYNLSATYTANAGTTLYPYWEAQSILHVVSGGEAKTITNIKVVESGTVRNIIGCYAVVNGEVHQGV